MVAQLTLTPETVYPETGNPVTLDPAEGADWLNDAACAAEGPAANAMLDLFFSEELPDIAAAKRICATCPVMADCLEAAMERREPWGVWGGQLFTNGRVLLVKRRRGRPRKVTRPEDEVPSIPVPEHLVPLLRTA